MAVVDKRATCIEVIGIDGAGKSTVVASLSQSMGWRAAKVRPFDDAAISKDRQIFETFGVEASNGFRSCALAAALLWEASQLTEPAVFDRYIESARMWWHVNDTSPLAPSVLAALPAPALVIFLDIPVDVGLSRRLATTAHTSEQEERFMKACAAYLCERAAGGSGWARVDATRPLPEVLETCAALARDVPGRSPITGDWQACDG
jgi:thymidylate kinase